MDSETQNLQIVLNASNVHITHPDLQRHLVEGQIKMTFDTQDFLVGNLYLATTPARHTCAQGMLVLLCMDNRNYYLAHYNTPEQEGDSTNIYQVLARCAGSLSERNFLVREVLGVTVSPKRLTQQFLDLGCLEEAQLEKLKEHMLSMKLASTNPDISTNIELNWNGNLGALLSENREAQRLRREKEKQDREKQNQDQQKLNSLSLKYDQLRTDNAILSADLRMHNTYNIYSGLIRAFVFLFSCTIFSGIAFNFGAPTTPISMISFLFMYEMVYHSMFHLTKIILERYVFRVQPPPTMLAVIG